MGDSTDRTDVVAPGQSRRVLDQTLPGRLCSEHTTSLAIFRWGAPGSYRAARGQSDFPVKNISSMVKALTEAKAPRT